MYDSVGQQLGNYYLVRLLGRGGFSNVYLGEHIYLKTQAAIKVLQMQLEDDEKDHFLHEARTIAHLVHPHIIRVLDFGVQNGLPFLVMDYAPQGTLRERHPNGTRLPLATIVEYVKQVALALQYAHDHNFIHRDVKPGNMLIGRQGEILLSDFGTALVAQSSNSQSTQDTVGTIAYMAPEQIDGKPRPASDQYALGIVVYEWLSGQRPFSGSLTELIAQQMSAPPPSLHARNPDISPDVEAAVMMALAKDPHERFASVQAFANALEQANRSQQGQQGQQEPTRGLYPVSSPSYPPTRPALVLPSPALANTSQTSTAPQQLVMETATQKERPASKRSSVRPPQERAIPRVPGRSGTSTARQLMASIIGIVIYGGVYFYISTLFFHNKEFASYALFGLSIIVPLFFGAVFGPFAGFFTGMGGYLLGHSLSGSPGLWSNGLGLGLTGLIAGFALLRTRAHYDRFRAVATAVLFAVLGVIVGEGFADCSSIWVYSVNVQSAALNFLLFTLIELICGLVLLPILLKLYSAIAGHRERSEV